MAPPKLASRRDPLLQPPAHWELERAVSIGVALRDWYTRSGRAFAWRGWTDTYRLAVVEILLQRTRAQTIADFAPVFFERFPDWRSLAVSTSAELEELLAPIGLQKRRAASLAALARAVVEDELDPGSRAAPGVGQYISRAIAVSANDDPVAMVDSNWVRVLRRVFGGTWMSDYRYDPRLQSIALEVVRAGGEARRVNWAVLDLGATVCRPRKPACSECPLATTCDYAGASQHVRPGLGE